MEVPKEEASSLDGSRDGSVEMETKETDISSSNMSSPSSYLCYVCGKTFSNKSNLLKHANKLHGVKMSGNRQNYTCSACSNTVSFGQLSGLRKHHVSSHGYIDEVRTLRFSSRAEFNSWKDSEERQTKTRFVAKTGAAKLQNGKVKQYYLCHRSGNYIGKGCGKRRLKWQGSCKTGQFCLASMELTEIYIRSIDSLDIIVQYHCNHYGHDFDISHLGTPEQGVSFEHFLDQLKSNNHDQFNRLHLMPKRELYNVQRKFKFPQYRPLTKDVETLDSWLGKSLVQGDQSPVLYCKDRGVEDNGEENEECLEADDFLLVLSNPLQRDILAQFGSSVVCIDCVDTGMPQEIALTAVVVLDEFEEPFPVAFCLSNRIDFTVFKRFFECLQVRVGNIASSILVSNDMPDLYGAWGQVMGECEHHQLCSWYTEKCWKSLMAHIATDKKSKHMTVSRWLKTMMKMTEIERFNDELEAFLEKMAQDEETKMFLSCFRDQFAARPEMWAHCYLGPKWTSIAGNLEMMHRALRNSFNLGKDFGHIVRCITSLCKLVRDRNSSRLSKMVEGIDNVQGQEETAGIVVEVMEDDCQWRLQNSWGESFQVQRVPQICREEDSDKSYSCTCIENLAYSKCCQHITVVMQLQQYQDPPSPTPSKKNLPETEKNPTKGGEKENPQENRPERLKTVENRVKKKAEALFGFLKKKKLNVATLSQVEKRIDECLDIVQGRNCTADQNVDSIVTTNAQSNVLQQPSVDTKVPIDRYKSPLGETENKSSVSATAAEVHSGFDHVY